MTLFNGIPWELIWFLLYSSGAIWAVLHAVLHAQDARAAWGWMAICLLFPFIGAVLYYLLGVNRIRKHTQRPSFGGLRASSIASSDALLPEDQLNDTPLRSLARTGAAMGGSPLVAGNRFRPLINGEEAYPAMLEAIANARHSIDLMAYIFLADGLGRQFIEALAAAKQRGVMVRVLLDGVSDLVYWPRASWRLRRAKLRWAAFNPIRFWPPMLHVNLRNHRKLLVVDGERAFSGGMNIADYHHVTRQSKKRVVDLHFEIEGPVVEQLAAVFAADWVFTTGEDEHVNRALTPLATTGSGISRVLVDGPDDQRDPITLVLLAAMASATRRICIVTPYFLPPQTLMSAMQSAALRGVKVDVLLPHRSNHRSVDRATRHLLGPLLENGVQVAQQPAPFAHTKLFLVDGRYVQFGSANLDARSLRLNFEMNVEAFDDVLATDLEAYFDRLLANSMPVSLARLRSRTLPERLRDAFFWLFSHYL